MLFRILFLLFVVCHVKAKNPLEGAWSTYPAITPWNCQVDTQLSSHTFLSIQTGPNCVGALGVYGGIYSVSDSLMSLQYSIFPLDAKPATLVSFIITNGGNTMTMTIPGSDSFTLTRVPGFSYDGVYDGEGSAGGGGYIPIRSSIFSNMFISYNLYQQTVIFMGQIINNFPTNGFCRITYAYSGEPGIAPNTVVDPMFTVTGVPPNTVITINSTQFQSILYAKHPVSELDGTWVGLNTFGYLTVEMESGVFRAYNMAVSYNSGFLGTFNVNDTALDITFGYTQPLNSSLLGGEFSYPYTLSSDGNMLIIDGPERTVLNRVSSNY